MISVPESMHKPPECVDINVRGLLNVLEEAAQAKVKKLCFSSSAAIYGDNPAVPKLESMLPEPRSPYAITKLDGEYYCNMYTVEGRLDTACLRYFNVFGPRQDPGSAYAAAVPIFTAKAVANETITIYGDGEQTRDFIFVKDIVAANVHMALSEHCGVYNVAYGQRMTINALVEKIKHITHAHSPVQYLPARAGDVKHSMADVSKLSGTGFEPTSDFDNGLQETVRWFARAQ